LAWPSKPCCPAGEVISRVAADAGVADQDLHPLGALLLGTLPEGLDGRCVGHVESSQPQPVAVGLGLGTQGRRGLLAVVPGGVDGRAVGQQVQGDGAAQAAGAAGDDGRLAAEVVGVAHARAGVGEERYWSALLAVMTP
jgi:hypothetical protein